MTVAKLYCYVDETGQDTKGKYSCPEKFCPAGINPAPDSEKRPQALGGQDLSGQLYSSYENTAAYQELTVLTVAAAIHATKRSEEYKASIFIDGLQKPEVAVVSTKLRRIGIRTEKVRGVRDESHALIRLADAMAGFIREYKEGRDYAVALHAVGIKNKALNRV